MGSKVVDSLTILIYIKLNLTKPVLVGKRKEKQVQY